MFMLEHRVWQGCARDVHDKLFMRTLGAGGLPKAVVQIALGYRGRASQCAVGLDLPAPALRRGLPCTDAHRAWLGGQNKSATARQ